MAPIPAGAGRCHVGTPVPPLASQHVTVLIDAREAGWGAIEIGIYKEHTISRFSVRVIILKGQHRAAPLVLNTCCPKGEGATECLISLAAPLPSPASLASAPLPCKHTAPPV